MGKFKKYERLYGWVGLGLLLASTLIWSIDNARIQAGNADQLVSAFLFENGHTFAGATFPVSHTQLFKWPLFFALRWLHFSASSFVVATVLVSLVTVGGFAYLLYRVCKKPLIFGTVCMALGSVLLLVPAQINGNVAAPLGLAMLSGRNVEYLLYIGVLVLCMKAARFRSWYFLLAVTLLSVLAASDHLFLYMSLAASGVLFAVTWLANVRALQDTARVWLGAGVMAWPIAAGAQWMAGHFTHIFNDATPYAVTKNWHTLQPAVTGTAKAISLNFGITAQSGGLTIVPLLCNGAILAAALFAGYRIIKKCGARDYVPSAFIISRLLLEFSSETNANFVPSGDQLCK